MTDAPEKEERLAWGGVTTAYLIPGTRCAWSARGILHMYDGLDLVWDRQNMVGSAEDRHDLANWLNGGPLDSARNNVKRWVNAGQMSTREAKPFILYHDDGGTIFGNPNASAGYLYMVGFLEKHLPEGHPTRGLELYLDAHGVWAEGQAEQRDNAYGLDLIDRIGQ